MTKRARSEESMIELSLSQECDTPGTAGERVTAGTQERTGGQSATSGSLTPKVATLKYEEVPPADVAAEELLAASPFWALLLRAGYTWW